MSLVYMMSDTHFQHKNICKFRTQFVSIEHHDATLLNNILDTVGKRDTLWLLGDTFMPHDAESLTACVDIYHELHNNVGNLRFILGNHCTDNPYRNMMIRYINQDHDVHSLVKYKGCWLSHVPIHPSELRGKFNIYGHTHNNKVDDHRYYPVSCEHIDYKPKKFEDIIKELRANMRKQDILDEVFEDEWEATWDEYEKSQDLNDYIQSNYSEYTNHAKQEGWDYE